MTTQRLSKLAFLSPKGLATIATVLSLPFLSFLGTASSWLIPDKVLVRNPDWLTPLSIVLAAPFMLFAWFIFQHLAVYVATAVASAAVTTAGLLSTKNKLLRIWLLIVLCSIVAFPLLYRYRPALEAAPGTTMQWVTNPGFFGGIVKASQNAVEQTPCEYELLGWNSDNQLYYRATCGTDPQIWQYTPTQPGRPAEISSSPADLSRSIAPTALDMVRAGGVRPQAAERSTRSLLLEDSIVSPDGQWTAMVTQHTYGTQDVIVLTSTQDTH